MRTLLPPSVKCWNYSIPTIIPDYQSLPNKKKNVLQVYLSGFLWPGKLNEFSHLRPGKSPGLNVKLNGLKMSPTNLDHFDGYYKV